jgi:hypothetical protein
MPCHLDDSYEAKAIDPPFVILSDNVVLRFGPHRGSAKVQASARSGATHHDDLAVGQQKGGRIRTRAPGFEILIL